ncbi:chromosome segregation SMC family protein [Pleomorphomonas koreensis]|uniref:chromosome segregation SMC family protein n=1 Tax=Pleomorphomonas koreensis TaxID=257440 RepID=UPI00041B7EDE|nr:chromosome segregation SMC family protein [Pleomorphomonas koreensis]
MQFERLKIQGFKSFVDVSEFVIEPGLTGVVGPNGCGKSNLVEAMRWVMGESSYKAMRASGMDDVIFSGSGKRPARNAAEVTLVLRNDQRTAPAAFNDADLLEVTRRIERQSGSAYRINGKEVRARDVQLLFADASTGARSPAMVRQGQIGELIAAKPTQRRTILEEAAGISGLHSRRHDAELRLKAAETNLTRMEDVLREIEARLEGLRKQARQAARYRNLSADIRKAEATVGFLRLGDLAAQVEEAEAQMKDSFGAVADAQSAQTEAVRRQAIVAAELPALRDRAVETAAALQRLRIALAESEAEERRARERLAELTRRAEEIARDRAREAALVAENDERLAALADEAEALAAEALSEEERRAEAEAQVADIAGRLAAVDADLAAATAAEAEAAALRGALEREIREAGVRLDRMLGDLEALDAELAELDDRLDADDAIAAAREEVEYAAAGVFEAEEAVAAAEAGRAAAEAERLAATGPLAEAERELQKLDTEARTLARMLDIEHGQLFPPLVDRLTPQKGFETALAAALGEDIEAPMDDRAPAYWTMPGDGADDPPLPDGVPPLSKYVEGPDLIRRRLRQIGVVKAEEAARLQPRLAAGQMLVTLDGALWRWDGYAAAADAPTIAAGRLAARNRLAEIDALRDTAAGLCAARRLVLDGAEARLREAEAEERAAREAVKAAERAATAARDGLLLAERALAETVARRAAAAGQRERLAIDAEDLAARKAEAEERYADLADAAELAVRVQALRMDAAEMRARFSEARAAVDLIRREGELRGRRRETIDRERAGWGDRVRRAAAHLDELDDRLAQVEDERAELIDRPDEIVQARRGLMRAIGEAETAATEASDRLRAREIEAGDADRAAAEALSRLSTIREGRVRAEERLSAVKQRLEEYAGEIRDRFDAPIYALRQLAEIDEAAPLPDVAGIETRLERLRVERDKLGGVNLQAETEQAELEERLDTLVNEREDLIEAIRRLRQGIQNLNREARERLLNAFGIVNAHFQRLFVHLFGGGTAELQLVDAEDPLEAGLEILARPPGKKPQTMTLLSGGEQALTAMALIFAVFLTNPAPICVLDEVDAPLDDANVERYCDLLEEMARSTETRFVVITHNPITMARMNRLFGVTMAERGVSQLVSVDLETAESFREAS